MARQLVLELLGDSSKLQKTLGDADEKAGKFGGGLGKLAGAAAGLFAGAKVLDFGRDAVAAFTESEQAQSKLELALKNSSLTVGVHADDFAKLNKELAKHTLVDDDVIAATEAQMVTFGASKEQIKAMIPTVLDFAAKMGVDAPTAADLFDKASMGSVKALKTLGIEGYKPTGDKATDLANVQALVAEKTKGAAQAQLDAAGPGAKMNKSMDELKETIGSFLVPALEKVTSVAVGVSDFLATHPVVTKFAIAGGVLAAAIWGVNAATEAWTVAQGAFNTVMALNPVVLVIAAVVGLGVAIYEAYQHFGPFHDAVDAAWRILQTGFNWVKDNWPLLLGILTGPIGLAVVAITTHWDTIKSGFTGVKNWIGERIGDVVGFFTGLPGRIASAASTMWDGIKAAFKNTLNAVIGLWNELKIPSFKIGGWKVGPVTLPTIDTPAVNFPNIPPLMDTGGIIQGPGVFAVGPIRERVTPLGQERAVNITINTAYVHPDIGVWLLEQISREMKRSGVTL